jgi:5-methylcytosine-specific restriction enzyme subunit McrC
LSKPKNHIVVFEHEILRFDKGEKKITEDQFKALERFHGNGVPYFKLIFNGVQFNENVGVLQVGDTLIEVLPKADKNDTNSTKWRKILIGMLRAVGSFDIKETSSSNLKIKPNTILDLYFELFISQVEYLLHTGLVKQYRKKEGNVSALKGNLLFNKHIQHNLTHHERLYVRHTTYDLEHTLHFILYKTIHLLKQMNSNTSLNSRIGALLLQFPEMPDIKVSKAIFEKLNFNRKTQHYKKSIEIAKLLLLQYHPDITKGHNDVLALMFDMNLLWEQFIYITLRKKKEVGTIISAQTSKYFWKPENGRRSIMKPDIWIQKGKENIILDTKWKNLNGFNPSPDDLRQMYVYHEYYDATKVALVYPGKENSNRSGHYLDKTKNKEIIDKECSIILIAVDNDIKKWQTDIQEKLLKWFDVKNVKTVF